MAQASAKTDIGAGVCSGQRYTIHDCTAAHSDSIPETNLGNPDNVSHSTRRQLHVTQAMVNNRNVVLAAGIAGKNITSVTTLTISTTYLNPPEVIGRRCSQHRVSAGSGWRAERTDGTDGRRAGGRSGPQEQGI